MYKTSRLTQPHLFNFSDSTTGVMELFPTVWTALEQLISNDIDERLGGLDRLLALNAHKLSPLVAYVLATCLADPNIMLRFEIVQTLGGLLSRDDAKVNPTDAVLQSLKAFLSKMRQRNIYALLEVADYYPSSISNVAALLKACSHAGGTLSDIFSDRKIPIGIRRQAITFSGIVGFLDAIPALERLAGRLESRMSGQRLMPFAPPADDSEKSLLPTTQTALSVLSSP